MKSLASLLVILLLASTVAAYDYPPGPKQSTPVLLKGGTVFTISDGIKENSDVLFVDGVITEIGAGLTPPEGCEVIDVTGKHVYPGLIALGTNLGLVEIGNVLASDDRTEVGDLNPDVQSHIAYEPDSEVIPTVRSNGIAYAQVIPNGSLIRGRSCLLNLDAWTKEDAAVELNLGLHVSIPSFSTQADWWDQRSPEERAKQRKRDRKKLWDAFEAAAAYKLAREADPGTKIDSRWEAMRPMLAGEKPVFVHANDYREIEFAVHFADKYGLRIIIMGGSEAWKMADLLAKKNIPVIFKDAHGLPLRQDDPYDQMYRAAALLHEAGVTVAFDSRGATGVRNVPFRAGMASGWGLPKEVALRSLTLTAAEILGVDDRIGSLEVGKRATVIVSEGDIMDHLTHNVTHMFIDGRRVDLDSKHKELYRKYRNRKID
jgi:imidazolonepropionase-like amidohydrolase